MKFRIFSCHVYFCYKLYRIFVVVIFKYPIYIRFFSTQEEARRQEFEVKQKQEEEEMLKKEEEEQMRQQEEAFKDVSIFSYYILYIDVCIA